MNHWKNDIVFLLVEFQHQLNVFELVARAEIDRGRRTEKIHPFGTIAAPVFDIFKIEPGFFLLKKYSHTLHTAPHQFLLPLPPRFRCAPEARVALGVCSDISQIRSESNGLVNFFQ